VLLQTTRKMVVLVLGLSVVGFGIALIVLPGPAFLVIPAGLAILGTEFLWARRLLRRMKQQATNMLQAVGYGGPKDSAQSPSVPNGPQAGSTNLIDATDRPASQPHPQQAVPRAGRHR